MLRRATTRAGDALGLEDGRFGWRWIAGLAVVALATAALVHRLAAVAVTLPLRYSGDALLHAAYVQRMREAGWYLDNARLGAPWGLDASDFPLGGENVHWLALKLLGAVSPTPWAAVNAYYLLTYPLIAVAGFVVLRALRVRPALAATAGLLFAFLPFHQYRGTSHLLRSGYYVVPFLVLVVLWLAQPGRFLAPATGRPSLFGFRRDRIVVIGVLAVLVGANDTQNTAYGVLLIVLLAVAGSVTTSSFRPVLVALGFATIAGVSLLANNAPYVYTTLVEGGNDEVAVRPASDQELYGLRPAFLLLPIAGHRIEPVRAFMTDLVGDIGPGEHASQPLGLVGGAGLVASVLAAAVVLLGRRDRPAGPQLQTAAVCGLVVLVAIAVAVPGGLSFLLTAFGLTLYRTWNRISLFVGFSSLVAAAVLADLWLRRVELSRWRSLARTGPVAAVAALVAVVGVLDQTPEPARLTQSSVTVAQFHQDRDFYGAIEAEHPRGAMVFQLPVTRFPEGGEVFQLPDYEQLTGYLHTDELRWSAGAMRGRPASYWQAHAAALAPRDVVRAVSAAGFDGLVVHQRGFADGGAAVLAALEAEAGPPTVTGGRDAQHHDLTGVREALAERTSAVAVSTAGAQLVDPVRVQATSDVHGPEGFGLESFRWSSVSDTTLEVVNPWDAPRTVLLSARYGHHDPDTTWIRVEGPGIDRTLGPDDGFVTWSATLPPGTSELQVTSDGVPREAGGGDRRVLGLRLGHAIALDEEARTVLCAGPVSEDRPYCSLDRALAAAGGGADEPDGAEPGGDGGQ